MTQIRNVGPTPSESDAIPTVAQVNAKYTKPGTGIPESDLTSEVQTKLNSVPEASTTVTGGVKLGPLGFGEPPPSGDPLEPFYPYAVLGGTAAQPNIYYVAILVKVFSEWTQDGSLTDSPIHRSALSAALEATLLKADDAVTKAGTQTITGDKTFQGVVNVPTATAGPHAINKNSMDAALSGKVNNASGQSLTLWTGTQSAYDAIGTKDNNTIYVVTT